jgi:hypothetical protein
VVEWSITTDCKSVGFGLRRFESCPAHKYMEQEPHHSEVDTYKQRIYELTKNIEDKDLVNYFDEINTKAEEWKKVYGEDLRNYELFHALIGSSPMPGQQFKAFDLPGEDNVAAFIAELEKKYGSV